MKSRGRWAVVALLTVGVSGVPSADAGAVDAGRTKPDAASSCTNASGYADRIRVPRSISDLVGQSDAVVTVRVAGKEKPVSSQSAGGSTFFLMRSRARVEDVFKGDVEPSTNIDLHRSIIGHDLDGALAQSVCMVGAAQALTPGSRYLIGLTSDDQARWFAAAGPYSTIPFRTRGDRLVAVDECPVDGPECKQFPYTLAGQPYGALKAEAKAAAR